MSAPDGQLLAGAGAGRAAVYLFALVRAGSTKAVDWPVSVHFRPLVEHRAGPLGALVTFVPRRDYEGPAAAGYLSDIAWITPRTLHHAVVLRQAMACSPVFPAPFATLYETLDSLGAFLLAHRETVLRFFTAVEGMEEWELQANFRLGEPVALEAVARDCLPDWPDLTPGTRYLRLLQDRPRLLAAARVRAEATVSAIAERLRPVAGAIRRIGRQRPPDAADGGLTARFALLVRRDDALALNDRTQRLAAEFADAGMALSLSGPWPPFSFRPDLPAASRQGDA